MIDVGVGKNERIDGAGVEAGTPPVHFAEVLEALEQPAIDECLVLPRGEKEAGAGHRSRAAVESKCERHGLMVSGTGARGKGR